MMTPGAIYFHVPNKQTLLLAVYEEGVQRIVDRVDRAIAGGETAWSRLAAAVEAHLEAILDVSAYARVVIRILPDDVPEVSADLTRLRDRYEERFRVLFGEVKLPEGMATRTCPLVPARRVELDAGLASAGSDVDL